MRARRLWWVIAVLALLTPLGIWLPQRLRAGTPWGEWSAQELQQQVGHVPRELARGSEAWSAPLPDYAPRGWRHRSPAHQYLAYIASAVIGLAVCASGAWLLGRWLVRREQRHAP
jgi:cobalt/nickel transport protein